MTGRQTASREDWLDAYEDLYESLPADPHRACPNCGRDALRIAFTGNVDTRIGYGSCWCDNCLFGIHLSRVAIPPDVEVLPMDQTLEERRQHVPNYTLVVS
jgi:hypothetical protein